MPVDERARALALAAAGLAEGSGVTLPDDLLLWSMAGSRPRSARPVPAADPAGSLGALLEASLSTAERRNGAHYTPDALADRVVELALPDLVAGGLVTVCDPSCGAGAVLLAAARRLASRGIDRAVVARDLLWGADVDPLAVAVAEAAITLWSGGVAPAPGRLVVGDTLGDGASAWPYLPPGGFGAVAGNPPFQGQLAAATARDRRTAAALKARFGPETVAAYTDTAALFALVGVELAAPGARVALVQPASVLASRDAAGVRRALGARAAPVDLWCPPGQPFAAAVQVCVPVLEVGAVGPEDWSALAAGAAGVPSVALRGSRTLADLADLVAGFRDEYYGLVSHVREASGPGSLRSGEGPLITSGLIDVGVLRWGERPVRFAKRVWRSPVVDLGSLASAGGRAAAMAERVRRPKVLVATQTRVVEAVADPVGVAVPATPVISVLPRDAADLARIEVLLAAPAVSAWVAARAMGTGLAPGSVRPTARLLGSLPVPDDDAAWDEAASGFDRWRRGGGSADDWVDALGSAQGVGVGSASAARRWWSGRLPGGVGTPDRLRGRATGPVASDPTS